MITSFLWLLATSAHARVGEGRQLKGPNVPPGAVARVGQNGKDGKLEEGGAAHVYAASEGSGPWSARGDSGA
jgi:hypothetical protein